MIRHIPETILSQYAGRSQDLLAFLADIEIITSSEAVLKLHRLARATDITNQAKLFVFTKHLEAILAELR